MLKLDYLDAIKKQRELDSRNNRALDYSRAVEARRNKRKAKSKMRFLAIGCLLSTLAFIKLVSVNAETPLTYQSGSIVSEGCVEINGNLFGFTDDRFQVGDTVTVLFDTKGNDDVTDDEIVDMVMEVR